jgi:hypothetical protein
MFVSIKYPDGTHLCKIHAKSFSIYDIQNTCNAFCMLNSDCNIVNKNNRIHIRSWFSKHNEKHTRTDSERVSRYTSCVCTHFAYVSVKSMDGTQILKIPSLTFRISDIENACNNFCMLNPKCNIVKRYNRYHIVMDTRLYYVRNRNCRCRTQCGCIQYLPVYVPVNIYVPAHKYVSG